jgi:hypothetical protein
MTTGILLAACVARSVIKGDVMTMLNLKVATKNETDPIGRELMDRRTEAERQLQAAHARRNAARAIAAQPAQARDRREQLELLFQAPQAGQTWEEKEALRARIHDAQQEELALAASPVIEQARAEAESLTGEIANLENALQRIERAEFDRKTRDLLEAIIGPAEHLTAAQRKLDQHLESGRQRGYPLPRLGLWLEPHPRATRDDQQNYVVIYLRFVLAGLDPAFAATLEPNSPERRLLNAVAAGSGIAAPALKWG